MRILLTGGTGFVGSAIRKRLASMPGLSCVVASRRALNQEETPAEEVRAVQITNLDEKTDWGPALEGVTVVVHTAARVHVMAERIADPLAEFRKINVRGTLNLARQAAAAGVKRFVFISSIKVNGEATAPGMAYTADDEPAPLDAYGISKAEAEKGLRALSAKTGMEVAIIRPVLVYGPGVKANFRSMMTWLRKGVPLPLGAIDNKRSLVALDNLVDLIVTCLDHPAAANQTFLVSDGEDLSTTALLRRMGQALGKPARLIPVPERLIWLGASLIRKKSIAQRLCGSLQVDIGKTHALLGWRPLVSVDQALQATAQHYLKQQQY